MKLDITLEQFIQALEKIRNLACIRVLTEEYNSKEYLNHVLRIIVYSYKSAFIDQIKSNMLNLNIHRSLFVE